VSQAATAAQGIALRRGVAGRRNGESGAVGTGGLQGLAWTEADLATRPKGDRAKVQLGRKLRMETTMTLNWIAAHLRMGAGANLSNLLLAQRREQE